MRYLVGSRSKLMNCWSIPIDIMPHEPGNCEAMKDWREGLNRRGVRTPIRFYPHYYNEGGTRLSLGKDAPIPRAIQARGRLVATPILGRLHHQYARV